MILSAGVVFTFFHLTWCSSWHTIHAHVNIRCITLSHNFHFLPRLPFSPYFLMDYNNLVSSIRDLTRSLTNWSSTVCIPTSESYKFLDISSAAKGNSSSTPLGATNQPTKYTTGEQNGLFYRFDRARYNGADSWKDLKACCVRQVVSVAAKFQLRIPGRRLHPKSNLTPLLVNMAAPMNHAPPLPLHPAQLVRITWLEKKWSNIRLEEAKVRYTTC